MKFTPTLIALAILSMAPSAYAADTLATVNGKVIKNSTYEALTKDAEARGQKIDAQVKQAITIKLINLELAYQEAQRIGLDKQAEYLVNEDLAKHEILSSLFIQDFLKKNPITESATKNAYDEYKKVYGEKEYSARHILVKTESEAKDIIAQLGKGGDVADPDDDGERDGHRDDLSGAAREVERPRGARAVADGVADGLCFPDEASHDCRRGERAVESGERARAVARDFGFRDAAVGVGGLQGRPAVGDYRRAVDDGGEPAHCENLRMV